MVEDVLKALAGIPRDVEGAVLGVCLSFGNKHGNANPVAGSHSGPREHKYTIPAVETRRRRCDSMEPTISPRVTNQPWAGVLATSYHRTFAIVGRSSHMAFRALI